MYMCMLTYELTYKHIHIADISLRPSSNLELENVFED